MTAFPEDGCRCRWTRDEDGHPVCADADCDCLQHCRCEDCDCQYDRVRACDGCPCHAWEDRVMSTPRERTQT